MASVKTEVSDLRGEEETKSLVSLEEKKDQNWRPKGYYYKLFQEARSRGYKYYEGDKKVKESVELLLTNEKEFNMRILIAEINQCEVYRFLKEAEYAAIPEEENKGRWVYQRGEYVHDVEDSFAQGLLENWNDWSFLPKRKKEVKDFEELQEVMRKLNPHWLLETYAIAVDNGDFARVEISDEWKYRCKNKKERKQVLDQLKEEYLSN